MNSNSRRYVLKDLEELSREDGRVERTDWPGPPVGVASTRGSGVEVPRLGDRLACPRVSRVLVVRVEGREGETEATEMAE
jgi:hypothetical protein